MRSLSFLIFLLGVLGVDALVTRYLWIRLIRDPSWPAKAQLAGTLILVALAVALPLGIGLGRLLPRRLAELVAYISFIWMGTAFLLASILAALDLLQLFPKLVAHLGGPHLFDPSRRQLLARGAAGVVTASAAAISAVSVRSALGEIEVKEVEVKLPRLPPAMSGFSIVQLTDIHAGSTIGRRFVEGLVEKTNREKPDLIVITGDLVDGSVARLRDQIEPLARLSARHGVYFVTGNHEYYSGANEWVEELRRLKIRVLRNERVQIGDDSASFDLAGVDDVSASRLFGHGYDLSRALLGRDPEREVVLLAHQPRGIDRASAAGVGLQVSGHTHGGQIWPFGGVVRLVQPYVAGLHRTGPSSQIYVSRGSGYWGPPMRFLAPAEVSKLVLT